MTVNPPTIHVGAHCGDVVQRMAAMKTGRLLVLKEQQLAGIVTRTDVMRALFRPDTRPPSDGLPAFSATPVATVMTKDPIVTQSHIPVEQAARILHERNVQALPVVDGRNLVGVVTGRDLAGSLAHLMGADIKGIRMVVDLPDELRNLRQLVEAMTPLSSALFPLTLAVRLDKLERRARLRVATPRALLVAETIAMEGVRIAGIQFDPPNGGAGS